MSHEFKRQLWYGMIVFLAPLAVWQLNVHWGWYAAAPPGVSLLLNLLVTFLILALLRLTNPWEKASEK